MAIVRARGLAAGVGTSASTPSKLSAVVRDNVRAERARRGWTLDELAELLGWQRASTTRGVAQR